MRDLNFSMCKQPGDFLAFLSVLRVNVISANHKKRLVKKVMINLLTKREEEK